jgi:hypothetical protein
MNTEERFTHARHQLLEESTPGSQALAEERASLEAVKTEAQTAEAQKSWQKVSDPAKVNWGKQDYNYVGAYCAGTNLDTGELPNRYFTPNSQNVAGHDLATGAPVKSVVLKDYAGNAAYGVGQLTGSYTRMGGERPDQDVVGLSAVAGAFQNSHKTYTDFSAAHPHWRESQKRAAWRAGTDSARQYSIVDQFNQSMQKWGALGATDRAGAGLVGLYPPSPQSMDFTVRMADPQFQKLGKTLHKHYTGMEFNDTDAAAARWLAEHMRDLDLNIWTWPMIMLKAKNAPTEIHQAYAQALESWSQTNIERSFLGQLSNARRVILDPTNYVGMGVGKLTMVSAGRAAAMDFFKRMALGAAVGAPVGAAGATAKASVSGRDPTGAELAASAVEGGAGYAVGSAAAPEVMAALLKGGQAIARGIKGFRRNDLPNLPSVNVNPRPIEGEYIPAGEGAVQTVERMPTPAERAVQQDIEARQLTPESEEFLRQRPFEEGDPVLAQDRALVQQGQDRADLETRARFHEAEVQATMDMHGITREQAADLIRRDRAATGNQLGEPLQDGPTLSSLIDTWIYENPYYGETLESRVRTEMGDGALSPETRAYLQETDSGLAVLDAFDMLPGQIAGPHGQAWGGIPDFDPQVQSARPAQPAEPPLPPIVNPPPLPRDPNSRVFIDPSTGYYSPVQYHVANSPMGVMTGTEWANVVMGKGDKPGFRKGKQDVREDEIAAMGLEEFLKSPENAARRMKKEEVLDFIDDNLVKIQRYPLIPQVRQTVAWQTHLLNSNPEYQRLRSELNYLIETGGDIEGEIAVGRHMEKVAYEARRAAISDGQVPPGIHGIEHMITGASAYEAKGMLRDLMSWMEEEIKHTRMLERARTDQARAKWQQVLTADRDIIMNIWEELDKMAINMGAVVTPEDLNRVLPHFQFDYQDIRYSTLLGNFEPGGQVRNGVDPLGHQAHTYIHPEGLQIAGPSIHPGGKAKGIVGFAYSSFRRLLNGETMHFIDEGQSDLVKARYAAEQLFLERKKKLAGAATASAVDEPILGAATYDDFVWTTYRQAKEAAAKDASAARRVLKRLPQNWEDTTPGQRVAMRKDPIWSEEKMRKPVPGMPAKFQALPEQIFAHSAQTNIFKAELFDAARSGKDWFGWTTTEVAQMRYPSEGPKYLEGDVRFTPDQHGRDEIRLDTYDKYGRRTNTGEILTMAEVEELADKLPEAHAKDLRSMIERARAYGETMNELMPAPQPHQVSMDLTEKVTYDPGSFHDYNKKVKNEMEKFLKRYGAKVELVEMPIAPGSSQKVKVWGVRLNDGLAKKLLEGDPAKKIPAGVPMGAAAGAAVIAGQEDKEIQ